MITNLKQAAQLYKDAWNKLDFTDFFNALSDDCKYSSQYVLEELDSKDKIISYFTGKIEAIKASNDTVIAVDAILQQGASLTPPKGTPCVAVSQDDSTEIAAIVFFTIQNNKIKRFDLCIPELYQVTVNNS